MNQYLADSSRSSDYKEKSEAGSALPKPLLIQVDTG